MKVTRNGYIMSLVMITIHNTEYPVSEENGFLSMKIPPIYMRKQDNDNVCGA